ncbi:hypothetical protein FA743_00825 [Paracoccus gahaiensis]|uniref:Uncharacterized protein n=1 Tax=Paracoccus gahaiensis TaxID=1706839 RepID=A0A4U0REI7_9RHOB|nr:hypothetical protein [Paracoccus gahaiensis]TJZ93851.1 hypothetical protein FA743_00825 [Paracoccus gahaiensis]
MRDIYANIDAVSALAPAVQAAAAQGEAIDLNGKGGVAFLVNTGAIAGSGDYALTLQESDTGTSGWTAVAGTQIDSNAPATLAADSTYRLGYRGWKRYVRVSLTKAGGTSIIAGAAAVFVPLTRPAA